MELSEKNQGLTRTLFFVVFIVSLGSWFPVGYTTVALNGPQSTIVQWIRSVQCSKYPNSSNTTILVTLSTFSNLTADEAELFLWCRKIAQEEEVTLLADNIHLSTLWALSVASGNIGWFLSIFVNLPLLKAFGLKGAILFTGVGYVVSITTFCIAPFIHSYQLFVAGRVLMGLTGGTYMVITPMYISEITPVKLRGTMSSVPQVLMVLGQIAATALGFPDVLGNANGWPYLMGIANLTILLLLATFPICPESPRRLYIVKKDREAARRALMWLRRTENVEDELALMQTDMEKQTQQHQVSMLDIFRDKRLRSPLWLCLVAMVARQFSGYTVIANYSTAIFTGVGLDRQGALFATLGLWGVSLIGTFISLVLIDRAGRKPLFLTCQAGLVIALSVFVAFAALKKEGHTWTEYGSVACLFAVLLFYQTGLASIAYILPTELFGQEARSAAISIATGVAALCAVCTTFLFPVLEVLIQEYTYTIFIAVLLATAAYLAAKLPETKGKTIAEIQEILRK